MDVPAEMKKTFSFEFFPPRNAEAASKLCDVRDRLAKLDPDYFSVTFGAGGSTREHTFDTVLAIRDATGIAGVPHVSCVGSSKAAILEILDNYRRSGIRQVVALRGDLPSGSSGYGELRYANELVEFIRRETGDYFHIEVAAYPEFHPQAPSTVADLENFKRKVMAGANSAITQYFYNADAYFRFVGCCTARGIAIPIVPGIMPILNVTQLVRFSEACGAEIPRWILKRLRDFGDDRQAIRDFGCDVTAELCRRLLDGGAPGLHIYTMNQADASEAIWRSLDLAEFPRRAVSGAA
jgi:methylenetetrahydrofolate reductase (NADPH)